MIDAAQITGRVLPETPVSPAFGNDHWIRGFVKDGGIYGKDAPESMRINGNDKAVMAEVFTPYK
jgi:hypothetical protein